jgi:capsular polysaccharide biosynthesis protein
MENTYSEQTMRDYLRVIFRQKAVVITTIVTVLAAVAIGLQFRTPVYEAQVKLLISAEKQVEAPYYRDLISSRMMEVAVTQSEIVNSIPVLERTVNALGLYARPFDYEKEFCSWLKKPLIGLRAKMMAGKLKQFTPEQQRGYLYRVAIEDLRSRIKVEPIRDTNAFTIKVKEYSPVGAATIANTLSRSFVIFDLEQQVAEMQLKYGEKHPTAIQLQDNINKVEKTLKGEPVSNVDAIGPASVKIIEQAVPPIEPTGISNIVTLILAFVMSIFLALMLAFVFEYLDQTFKSRQEIENGLNLPLLGFVPKGIEGRDAALRNLSDQVYLLARDKHVKSILISAIEDAANAMPVIAGLGGYLADKAGHKTLLIDANFRDPVFSKHFRLAASEGLAGILEGRTSFPNGVKELSAHLSVLPAGKTGLNPLLLLDSHKMLDVLKAAKDKYETILIHSTDLLRFRDPAVLAPHVDGAVVIIEDGRTRRQVAKAAIETLSGEKVHLLGVILNNRVFAIPRAIYRAV